MFDNLPNPRIAAIWVVWLVFGVIVVSLGIVVLHMEAMAPKKKGTTQKKNYNPYYLKRKDAYQWFISSIVSKNLILKRSCALDHSLIFDNIQAKGWQDFTNKPEAAVILLVHEF